MKRRGFFRILGSGFLGSSFLLRFLGCGQSSIVASDGDERALKPLDQQSQKSSLVKAMRERGYYLTAWQTSLGPIADGIYRRSKIHKAWILAPVMESNVEQGEGLIYVVYGKPFPLEDAFSAVVDSGDLVQWRKKLSDGSGESRTLSIRL